MEGWTVGDLSGVFTLWLAISTLCVLVDCWRNCLMDGEGLESTVTCFLFFVCLLFVWIFLRSFPFNSWFEGMVSNLFPFSSYNLYSLGFPRAGFIEEYPFKILGCGETRLKALSVRNVFPCSSYSLAPSILHVIL